MSKAEYLVFDTETGGVDTENDPVLQCFIATADKDGKLLDTWEFFIYDPDRPGSPEAAEVHGFTTEWLKEAGGPPKATFDRIREVFIRNRNLIWVAYNLSFDLSILDAEFKRYGVSEMFGEYASKDVQLFDPLVVDREKDKYRKGNRKLESVAPHYGLDFDPDAAHNAVYDVEMTAKVAAKVRQKFGIPNNAEQAAYHKKWAEGLTAYFQKTGKKSDDGSAIVVETGWPLRKS